MKEQLLQGLIVAEIELDNAIHASNRIQADKGSYYYTEPVPYEHRYQASIGGLKLGWSWKTETRYRNESRFNQQKFDADSARAGQNAAAKKQQISEIVTAIVQIDKQEEAEVRAKESLANKDCALYQANISSLSSSLAQLQSGNKALSFKVNQQNELLQNVKSQVSQVESQILNINRRISDSEQAHAKNQESIKGLQEKVLIDQDTKDVQEAELRKQIQDIVESMDAAHRTDLLIKLWGKTDYGAKDMVQLILEHGFDVNYQDPMGHSIIAIAVMRGDMDLFELVMERFSDFDLEIPTVNGQTLLEYAAAHEKTQFIDKILNSGGSLSRTVLHALKDDNEAIIAKLCSFDSSIIDTMYQGNSLLHLAIIGKKVAVMNTVLKADSSSIEKVNFKGDTCFMAALKCGEKEIIKLLLEHVDAGKYMLNLISESAIDLLCILFETSPDLIDCLQPELFYKLICEKQFALVEMMLDYGFDLGPVIETIIANDNKEALVDIYNIDVDYMINCKFDKQQLATKCTDWELSDIAHKITTAIVANDHPSGNEDISLAGDVPDPLETS